jgi:hypothetical protein
MNPVKQPPPAEAYYDIFEEIKKATEAFYPKTTYWDEKAEERRDEFKQQDAEDRERAYPERRPA